MTTLELVGAGLEVPLVTGGTTRYVNLDYAASTPALVGVVRAVEALLPFYSSVHRGTGFTSVVSTEAYEGAREAVRAFFGVPEGHTVVFTRNTTDSLNLLAAALPAGTHVLSFASEHHANLLAWRREGIGVELLPISDDAAGCVALAEEHLRRHRTDLLAVTGASNVTGEIWPVAELARVAHEHGARIAVDAAQLAPHVPVDVGALGVDYLAASGHKMYAPFGAGVLIGSPHWLGDGPPLLRGGGAVRFVTADDVVWADLPDRQEAGSPNVVGAHAFGAALCELGEYGMDRVERHDVDLGASLRRRLAEVDGVEVYRLWPDDAPRTGTALFNVRGHHHSLVAAALSAEHGIGVRHGCFCAHPLIGRLLDVSEETVAEVLARMRSGVREPLAGAVRASVGVGSTEEDVERLVDALGALVEEGPRAAYAVDAGSGEYVLEHDDRPRPAVGPKLAAPGGATRR